MNKTELSKFISLILRHKPETIIGISLDEHGWANVDELIAGIAKTKEFNMGVLEEIVRTDDKQRFSFNEDKTLIRANQGHSIPVDVELDEAVPPEILWHGTGEKYVKSIDVKGLIPKSRLYVHLSKDEETAIKVGTRHGKPVLYRVKCGEMALDGHKFYLSKNGVWLTKAVPVKYLDKADVKYEH
ncbi:RNA 2'-phosphotransferase [Acetivibrio straminisolvens]|jgi:putative RNA 2'-phosphotransferase|uniref:Probable RNA 2'-phosphotransferase n=1 Tax=Acetivibrio straminisolvens JCM 21531 TaxID=1294263 RepID=W4VAF3_9FIRM|nr:RNA 2'-phosphotransferase [Acetivibrio straminisolvens]GAE90172.1 phosphotransferase [Acetivibrio straminisolvens JCM 21531]